jgi:serine/threonine protein kinase
MARVYGKRWEGIGNDLGEGSQAHVLRVRDCTGVLLGEFALKRISNPKRAGRFASEVEAIKRLDHRNIVKLVDHSALEANAEETEKQYIVMPVAAGGDLSKVVGRYQGDLDKVLVVARQIAEGLKAAHNNKIIHRNVKPENILFENDGDQVWVSDFGICLIADRPTRHTETGEVVGPVVFMTPELEGGGQLDVTVDADIYSLGKVIYYMLTGGVRLPRENLEEEKYAAVLAGPGHEDLRLLLTQMICPRPARIKDMATVIERLEQIQIRRQGGQTGLSAQGSAALDRLKASIAGNEIKLRREQDAVRKMKDLLDAVQRSLIACLKAQLELATAEMHTPGALKTEVRDAPAPAQRTLTGRGQAPDASNGELGATGSKSRQASSLAL